ncbi:MAG: YhbY family RNA-binding protein [Tissierellia bacterium]|nr:YhbY family RNA-binding protein [Tissierellia bacterium]
MITGKQRSELKKISHSLKPQILIGKNGLSDNLLKQIGEHLEKNEIVKIKVLNNNLDEKDELVEYILDKLEAEFVSSLGNKFVIYKRNEESPVIEI